MTQVCETPVLLIIFNRPDNTRAVLDAIRKGRPRQLLIVADGPRANKPNDAELCRQTREVVADVDWPCEVFTDFAPANLGCRRRIISGLDWAFSLVDEAIILEDDCLPDPTFFPFCQELLERYRDDSRIAYIGGMNRVERHLDTSDSYYFSQLGGIWGWATWKSRWAAYDEHLTHWPALRERNALSGVMDRPKDVAYWTAIFDSMHDGSGPNTWDYQWIYAVLFGHRLAILPAVNLMQNIGFGPGATHTGSHDPRQVPSLRQMAFPLTHPVAMVQSKHLDHRLQDYYHMPLLARVAGKLKRMTRRA